MGQIYQITMEVSSLAFRLKEGSKDVRNVLFKSKAEQLMMENLIHQISKFWSLLFSFL